MVAVTVDSANHRPALLVFRTWHRTTIPSSAAVSRKVAAPLPEGMRFQLPPPGGDDCHSYVMTIGIDAFPKSEML